jgi:glycosyltransferase involved in cell wall biosynthesis
MRVTFVLPHLTLSGGNLIALMYADQLAKRGHEVTVLHGWMPRWRDRLLGGHVPVSDRVKLLRAGSGNYDRLGEYLPDADVLIATWWHTVEACAHAPASKGRKFHLVQGHEVFQYLPERSSAVYRLPFQKIVVSNWLKSLMRDQYGADSTLVMNPVDSHRFLWHSRDWPQPPRVGLVYSSGSGKNCEMAWEAFKLAKEKIPQLKLVCFSSEKLPEHWDAEFHYRPKNVPDIYRSCALWLWPSESEGFGLPILEAMSCGTPVIATKAGAAPDLVTELTGILIERTAPAMASAIVKLYSKPETEWRKMSWACRMMGRHHDIETAIPQFEAVISCRSEPSFSVSHKARRSDAPHGSYVPIHQPGLGSQMP